MKLTLVGLALLLVTLFTSGCNSGVYHKFSNVGLTFNREDIVLKDIPLPEDFVLLDGSFCYGAEAFRYGEFVYRGLLSVDDLFYYYKDQMPGQNWIPVSSQQFETHARMKFEKRDELCTVLLREGDKGTDVKIIVEQKKS